MLPCAWGALPGWELLFSYGIGGIGLKALLRWSLGWMSHCCPVETSTDHGVNCTASKYPKCLYTATMGELMDCKTHLLPLQLPLPVAEVTEQWHSAQGLKSKDCLFLTHIPCVVNMRQKTSPAGSTHQWMCSQISGLGPSYWPWPAGIWTLLVEGELGRQNQSYLCKSRRKTGLFGSFS